MIHGHMHGAWRRNFKLLKKTVLRKKREVEVEVKKETYKKKRF